MSDENEILQSVISAIEALSADWEYSSELSSETRLIADLQMKSLDLVVLCTTLVKQYGVMPMDELYTRLGEMPPETRELTVRELASFVQTHSAGKSAPSPAEVGR